MIPGLFLGSCDGCTEFRILVGAVLWHSCRLHNVIGVTLVVARSPPKLNDVQNEVQRPR